LQGFLSGDGGGAVDIVLVAAAAVGLVMVDLTAEKSCRNIRIYMRVISGNCGQLASSMTGDAKCRV
jgi:hypothetical protein